MTQSGLQRDEISQRGEPLTLSAPIHYAVMDSLAGAADAVQLVTSAEVRRAKYRAKEPAMKVLMVLTYHDKLGDTDRKTGLL